MGFVPLILALPLLELALFVTAARYVGLGGVMVEILLSGALGAALLRREGRGALARLRASVRPAGGQPQAAPLTGETILRFLPGLLLMLPGLLSDLAGLLLLMPGSRRVAGSWIARRAAGAFAARAARARNARDAATGGKIVDADYRIVEPGETNEDAPNIPPDRRLR